MDPKKTALILIGFQNDYFAADGILHPIIEEASRSNNVLANTMELLERLQASDTFMVTTPIIFTPNYDELVEPVGILKVVKEAGAFRAGSKGAEISPELAHFGDRVTIVPGKRGLNAFSNTDLNCILRGREIKDVVIAGAVTSVCIDSTGRAAFERGYGVTMLADCTSGRTLVEQQFYCEKVFPLYAKVLDREQLINQLGVGGHDR